MNTQEKIEIDFKTSLKSGDEVKKRTLRMALSAMKLAEVDKGRTLTDDEVVAIVQKEIKSLRESISDAAKAGRSDLIAETEPEIKILEQYLPEALSDEELEGLAKEAIKEVDANSPQDIGKVMKVLMPRIQGRAEGAKASSVVRNLLVSE